jgi:hypothetical protein
MSGTHGSGGNMNENQNIKQLVADSAPKIDSALKPGEAIAVVKNPAGVHEMVRGDRGRFKRSANAQKIIQKSTKVHDKFLFGKEEGKTSTRLDDLLKKVYDLAMGEEDAKNLVGIVKGLEQILLRSSSGKVPTRIENESTPITTIIVPYTPLMHPEPIVEKPRPALRPSFLEDDKNVINGDYVNSEPAAAGK